MLLIIVDCLTGGASHNPLGSWFKQDYRGRDKSREVPANLEYMMVYVYNLFTCYISSASAENRQTFQLFLV